VCAACFPATGFFFAQSFLTGLLQNFARRSKVAVDTVAFDFVVRFAPPSLYLAN
jgi:hypothetical protein